MLIKKVPILAGKNFLIKNHVTEFVIAGVFCKGLYKPFAGKGH